jgi:phosphoglycolate phosphatase-like HAD superfamily hydrolase
MIPQAAIFDLDDTLLNSKDPYVRNVHSVLLEMGIELPSERVLVGCTNLEMLKRTVAPGREEDFLERYMVLVRSVPYILLPGAAEVLQELTCPKYLWTSRNRETFLIRAAQSGLDLNLFQGIYTGDEVRYKKPDPRSLNEILKDACGLGITNPQKIICVSDAPKDIEAALSRGLTPFAVLTGIYTREEFSLQEQCILDSVKDLKERLNKI